MFLRFGQILGISSEYVQSIFRVCSKCVQSVFRVCSEYVQSVFRVSSECLQSVFRVSSECHQSVIRVTTTTKPTKNLHNCQGGERWNVEFPGDSKSSKAFHKQRPR